MNNGPIRCPNCKSQARTQSFSTVTAMAVQPGHYDAEGTFHPGVDNNTTTTHWKCTECGFDYTSYTQHGKTYQIT